MKYDKLLTLLNRIISLGSKYKDINEYVLSLNILNSTHINKDIYYNIIGNIWKLLYKDHKDYIMEFQVGNGGLDASNWTYQLLQIYIKYFNKHKIKHTLCDISYCEDGIRSAIIKLTCTENYLQGENGVHRLIRKSNDKRHTSFASVRIYDIIVKNAINIAPKDLVIETFRSSGAGGQHVNTTDSAVRIKHTPTGIVVKCQNERSQHQNKETAMKILYKKIEMFENAKYTNNYDELSNITWGSHFRSYIFDPSKSIKDHRLNLDIVSKDIIHDVLDGDIDILIREYQFQELTKIFT